MLDNGFKICKSCSKKQSFHQYYVDKRLTDGYANTCKECVKKRAKELRLKKYA